LVYPTVKPLLMLITFKSRAATCLEGFARLSLPILFENKVTFVIREDV
ncbi:MAG: hypothetical protein ACI9QN_002597, partial [Arcticibacterium sp.]